MADDVKRRHDRVVRRVLDEAQVGEYPVKSSADVGPTHDVGCVDEGRICRKGNRVRRDAADCIDKPVPLSVCGGAREVRRVLSHGEICEKYNNASITMQWLYHSNDIVVVGSASYHASACAVVDDTRCRR